MGFGTRHGFRGGTAELGEMSAPGQAQAQPRQEGAEEAKQEHACGTMHGSDYKCFCRATQLQPGRRPASRRRRAAFHSHMA
jgi:hypothetical protein